MKSDAGFSADSETHARAHTEDIILIKNSIYIVVLVRDKYSWEIWGGQEEHRDKQTPLPKKNSAGSVSE